jgi:hypothetical protein
MPLFGGNSAVLPGLYTVASLPPASSFQAKYAYVTDLGGGSDMVLSDGTNWKHIRRGLMGAVPAAAAISITPLLSPTIMSITGTNTASMVLTLQTANLYPGFELTIVRPTALAALTTLGIQVAGVSGLKNILGSSWTDYQWDGTALNTIRNSSLL